LALSGTITGSARCRKLGDETGSTDMRFNSEDSDLPATYVLWGLNLVAAIIVIMAFGDLYVVSGAPSAMATFDYNSRPNAPRSANQPAGVDQDLFTVRASPGRRPCEEVEDGSPDSWHARPWGGQPILFFPSRRFEAAGLKEGIRDHGHQGGSVQPGPGSAFEVVKAKLLLELLMRLLANPSGFDRGGERLEARAGRFDT
jgi:hypothetical protein